MTKTKSKALKLFSYTRGSMLSVNSQGSQSGAGWKNAHTEKKAE